MFFVLSVVKKKGATLFHNRDAPVTLILHLFPSAKLIHNIILCKFKDNKNIAFPKMQVFRHEFSVAVLLYFEQIHDGLQSRDSKM